VDFAGDAVALAEDGGELPLGDEQAAAKQKNNEGDGGEGEEDGKPGGLVEVGAEFEGESGTSGVPEAVVVGGLDAEGVAAGRDVGVVGGAAEAGFGPIAVEAF
jgi:hypothetical protein